MDLTKYTQTQATVFVMELPYFLGKLEYVISPAQAQEISNLMSSCISTEIHYDNVLSLKSHIEKLLNEYKIKANRNIFNPDRQYLTLDSNILLELVQHSHARFLDYLNKFY